MILSGAILLLALLSILNAFAAATCTAAQRLASSEQAVYDYNLSPAASDVAFTQLPFAENCQISIAADGLPAVPVAVDRTTAVAFTIYSRDLFSSVTGEYLDFPANGTTVITTNVTLGVLGIITVPVTYSAHVYLDYNTDCEIVNVRAFAQIPSQVLGLLINPPSLLGIL
ncbi:hypothetical protein EG329_012791 [Mollisiaceae sp. DMI_Dod_QoI]|nr:hypothetical protein EG329_012791 [Helotiales sp. DMI_Dod_QoI]